MAWKVFPRFDEPPIPLRYWVGIALNGLLWCVALNASLVERFDPKLLMSVSILSLFALLASVAVSLVAREFLRRASLVQAFVVAPFLLLLGLFLGIALFVGPSASSATSLWKWATALLLMPIAFAAKSWAVFLPATLLSVAMMRWFARGRGETASLTPEPPPPPRPGTS